MLARSVLLHQDPATLLSRLPPASLNSPEWSHMTIFSWEVFIIRHITISFTQSGVLLMRKLQ
jgi:hypothetical protein